MSLVLKCRETVHIQRNHDMLDCHTSVCVLFFVCVFWKVNHAGYVPTSLSLLLNIFSRINTGGSHALTHLPKTMWALFWPWKMTLTAFVQNPSYYLVPCPICQRSILLSFASCSFFFPFCPTPRLLCVVCIWTILTGCNMSVSPTFNTRGRVAPPAVKK